MARICDCAFGCDLESGRYVFGQSSALDLDVIRENRIKPYSIDEGLGFKQVESFEK